MSPVFEPAMQVLYFFESIRTPVGDAFMSAVTYLGEPYAFFAVALVMFWCVDKHGGYYLLATGMVGYAANQVAKLWFHVPRPWVLDPGFDIVESAREGASGYSFPSGHTATAATTYGGVLCWRRWRPAVTAVMAALLVIVPLSRMYLGVHTPYDVLASLAIGAVVLFGMRPFAKRGKENPNVTTGLLAFTAACCIAGTAVMCNLPFAAELDADDLAWAVSAGFSMAGGSIGLVAVQVVDSRLLRFDTKAAWWAQVLKTVLGIACVLVIMRLPLWSFMLGSLPVGKGVEYLVVVLFAGMVWPLAFPWFSRLGARKGGKCASVPPKDAQDGAQDAGRRLKR